MFEFLGKLWSRKPRTSRLALEPELRAALEQLKRDRVMRRFGPHATIEPRAEVDIARELAKAGHLAAAKHDLVEVLGCIDRDTARIFNQCSALEVRSLAAMSRHQIYRQITNLRGIHGGPEADAYSAIAHLWWIVGLALDRERKKELNRAIGSEEWLKQVEHAGLADFAGERVRSLIGRLSEVQAEAISAEIWAHCKLNEADRLRG